MLAKHFWGGMLTLLFVSLSIVAAHAEPPRTFVVLYVNPQGHWDRAVQEKWEAAGGLTAPAGTQVVSWTQAVSPRIGAAQRETLLDYPEMLMQSSRRKDVFAVRYVVIDRYRQPENGKSSPIVYDVADGSRTVLPDIGAGELRASEEALSKNLRVGMVRMSAPVWGHVTGKIYHVTGCDHVRQDQTIVIASEQEALRNGYEACAICFTSESDYRRRNGHEQSLGQEIAAAIEKKYHPDPSAERQARVERVGQRLLAANGLTAFHYTFRVLDLDEQNAFAAGAGSIYITRGLERVTAGNDDMLAAILGHEIGHTEEHHVLRQYRAAQTWAILGTIASVATGAYWPGMATDLLGGVIGRGHSRGFELEADRIGVIYAYDAGYRPEDFILVINALKQISGGHSTPAWLRTHPTEERRLAKTRELVAQLQTLDRVVASYATIDPGLAAYIRRHGVVFVNRTQELSAHFPTYLAALGPAPAAAATADDQAAQPSTQATDSQGVGAPSTPVTTAPVTSTREPSGTRVVPAGPTGGTRFVHD